MSAALKSGGVAAVVKEDATDGADFGIRIAPRAVLPRRPGQIGERQWERRRDVVQEQEVAGSGGVQAEELIWHSRTAGTAF